MFAMSPGDVKHWGVTYLVVIEENLISQPYMDEVLGPVGLPFLCQNQCKCQAWDDNAITHLARISNISFIRTMLCALTGQCANQTCLQFEDVKNKFLTEGTTHNTGTKKPPGSRCRVTGVIEVDY